VLPRRWARTPALGDFETFIFVPWWPFTGLIRPVETATAPGHGTPGGASSRQAFRKHNRVASERSNSTSQQSSSLVCYRERNSGRTKGSRTSRLSTAAREPARNLASLMPRALIDGPDTTVDTKSVPTSASSDGYLHSSIGCSKYRPTSSACRS
jgi:hypothetical protein